MARLSKVRVSFIAASTELFVLNSTIMTVATHCTEDPDFYAFNHREALGSGSG